jgi:hypothetical protein
VQQRQRESNMWQGNERKTLNSITTIKSALDPLPHSTKSMKNAKMNFRAHTQHSNSIYAVHLLEMRRKKKILHK